MPVPVFRLSYHETLSQKLEFTYRFDETVALTVAHVPGVGFSLLLPLSEVHPSFTSQRIYFNLINGIMNASLERRCPASVQPRHEIVSPL